jgi:drug/metabolite transporter (DMT)-like permease
VCFFWGTTYLGIRIALESLTPAMLMCARYLLSGSLLLIGAFFTGAKFPGWREMWRTAFYGLLTIGLGTGSLAYSEQWIPSALAAMIVTTQPFWMVGVEAMAGGERLHGPSVFGMLVGFAGVAFLFWPTLIHGAAGAQAFGIGPQELLWGFLILQFGAVTWAVGSIAQRKLRSTVHPFVSGGVQQLATGIAFAIPAFLGPHPEALSDWTPRGIMAVLYLAVFGGIVGYSSYIYSMHHLSVALVSIYTYVNPIVAVILGWLFYREPFGWREAIAMAIIFVGVAVVKRASASVRRAASE